MNPRPYSNPDQLRAHVHRRFEPVSRDEMVDCSGMTPAELYEFTHPDRPFTDDAARAFNALDEATSLAYSLGRLVETTDDKPWGVEEAVRTHMAGFEAILFEFIRTGKVSPEPKGCAWPDLSVLEKMQ